MGSLLGFLAGAVGLVGKLIDFLSGRAQRAAGAAQQKEADRKDTDREEEQARAVKNDVAAASDARLDQLRDKWTKP